MKKILFTATVLFCSCSLSFASTSKSLVFNVSVTIPDHIISNQVDESFLNQDFMQTASAKEFYKESALHSDTLVEMILRNRQPIILKSVTSK